MKYNNQFKMDVAIEVIQSKLSVSVVAKQYGIHPSTLYRFMNTNFEEIINRLDYLKYLKRMDRRDKKLESNQPLQEVSEIPTKKDTTIEITFLKSKKPLEKIKEESQVTFILSTRDQCGVLKLEFGNQLSCTPKVQAIEAVWFMSKTSQFILHGPM
ncbi:MAG: transposase [Bacteroidia bacterium]